jgi:hypothetical protein
MIRMIVSRSRRLASAAALAGLCSACGSVDPGAPNVLWSNMASFGSPQQVAPAAGVAPVAAAATQVDCPEIEVQDGTAALRVGGQENSSVRYQFDIANTARECHVQGGQFGTKVGVAGHLLIGPAGSPGAYSAQLRIVMRHDADQKPVFSQLYKIAADTAGTDQAPFQFVSDPIMLPFTTEQEDQEYTILVGFDNGPVEKAPKPRHVKHTN